MGSAPRVGGGGRRDLGRRGGRQGEGQALGSWTQGPAYLLEQAAEVRLFQHVEPTAAVLGGIAPGVERLADEGAERITVRSLDLGECQDLIDNAGQFEPGLAAVDLRAEHAAVKVVELLVEDADEDH